MQDCQGQDLRQTGLLQSTLTNPAECVIASEAKQSPSHFEGLWGLLRRSAPRNDRCGVDFATALVVCKMSIDILHIV